MPAEHSPSWVSTGIACLDEALGGVTEGDNIVWVCDPDPRYDAVEAAFIDEAMRARHPIVFIATTASGRRRDHPTGVEVLDASAAGPFAASARLIDEIEGTIARRRGTYVVVEDLDPLVRRWGRPEALAFFARTCPAMLQHGTVTYWRLPRRLGSAFIDRVRAVTQILLEVRADTVHVVKAESAPTTAAGRIHEFELAEGQIAMTPHPTSGRLARGLSAIRRELGLTQAQIASAAGVTPSAISQAESGARGLSIDTLLLLSDNLGVPLARLVNTAPDPGYRLARHDRRRGPDPGGTVALAEDPRLGLRAHLVALEGSETASAPMDHDGVELLAVIRGIVQVDLGADAPVLRPGDALIVTEATVRGWRNLRPDPATMLWVLRDQQQG